MGWLAAGVTEIGAEGRMVCAPRRPGRLALFAAIRLSGRWAVINGWRREAIEIRNVKEQIMAVAGERLGESASAPQSQ